MTSGIPTSDTLAANFSTLTFLDPLETLSLLLAWLLTSLISSYGFDLSIKPRSSPGPHWMAHLPPRRPTSLPSGVPPPVHPACGHQINVPCVSPGHLSYLLSVFIISGRVQRPFCVLPLPVQHRTPLSQHACHALQCARVMSLQRTKIISFFFMLFLPAWQYPSSSNPNGSPTYCVKQTSTAASSLGLRCPTTFLWVFPGCHTTLYSSVHHIVRYPFVPKPLGFR